MKTIKIKTNGKWKEIEISDESFKKLNGENGGRVRPEEGEIYWGIRGFGVHDYKWAGDDIDKCTWNSGDGFFSEEEAKRELERRKAKQRIKDWIRKKGYEFEPDWSAFSQDKYYPYYDHAVEKLDWLWNNEGNHNAYPYLEKSDHVKELIKEKEEDLLIYFGVKNGK